jgi:hypothetical protein
MNPKDLEGQRKPPLHLIPASAQILESLVLKYGAAKYGAFNWRSETIRASEYVGATLRHVVQWFDGNDFDLDSGLCHLAHARATLGILLDALSTENVIDDRPKKSGRSDEMIIEHTEREERWVMGFGMDTTQCGD